MINNWYQEKDLFKNRVEEISSLTSEQLNELMLDTIKSQVETLEESFNKLDLVDLISEWWDKELPVKVTRFLDTYEEFLRRWFDNLDPTHSLRRKFQTYDQFKSELSLNIGGDQWVALTKECFNSLIISPGTDINFMIQKFMDQEDGIRNAIFKILDSASYTQHKETLQGKKLTFEEVLSNLKEMRFDLTVTEQEIVPRRSVLDDGDRVIVRTEVKSVKIDLDDLNSASDFKNFLVQYVTEEFNSSHDAFIGKIHDYYKDLSRLTTKPRWHVNEETHHLSIELDVLWIDKNVIDDAKNLIKQNERILSEWKWWKDLTVEYSNLPTRQEWADGYVQNQWRLMKERCFDMLDKGFTIMDQVISCFNDCYQFVIEIIQMSADTIHGYKEIVVQLFLDHQLVTTLFIMLILYLIARRLIFNAILMDMTFRQQPIPVLIKTTGYLGLMIGSSVMLGGKWKGLNNFMVELIAKFLNLDGLGLWLSEQITGLELEKALGMTYTVAGISIMGLSGILLLLGKNEQRWGEKLRTINHGREPLKGLNPRWLKSSFNKKTPVKEQLDEDKSGKSKEETPMEERFSERETPIEEQLDEDDLLLIEKIREFGKWLRVHKQKQRVKRTLEEEAKRTLINDTVTLIPILKKKRDEGVDDKNSLDESLRDFIEVNGKKINPIEKILKNNNVELEQGSTITLDDLTKFCKVIESNLVEKTIENKLASTRKEALKYWDSEYEKVLGNLLENSQV